MSFSIALLVAAMEGLAFGVSQTSIRREVIESYVSRNEAAVERGTDDWVRERLEHDRVRDGQIVERRSPWRSQRGGRERNLETA